MKTQSSVVTMNAGISKITCFLCQQTGLRKDLKRKGRKRKLRPDIIFKYLLQSGRTEQQQNRNLLLESILKATEDGEASPIIFCATCESSIAMISELHLQLEAIQMKLIDCLNTVREAILKVSGTRDAEGTYQDTKVLVENAGDDPVFQNISEVFNLFKSAVSETKQQSVRIPLVYLKRFVNFSPNHEREEDTSINIPSVMNCSSPDATLNPNIIVKTEVSHAPEEDDLDDHESPMFLEQVEENMDYADAEPDFEVPTRPKTKRSHKRRRKRKSILSTPKKRRKAIIKTEEWTINKKMGFKCEVCPYESSRYNRYRVEHHLASHETSDKPFKCSRCPAHPGFSVEWLFQLHLKRHRQYPVCSYCNKKIPGLELTDHYRTHVDTVFQCESCTYCTTSNEKYLRHIQSYSCQTSTFSCRFCQETFPSRMKLLAHLHEQHNAIKKIVCEYENCGKEFLSKIKFSNHLRIHNDPDNNFVCQECGKILKSAVALKNHQNLHTGERPHSCDQCPQSFHFKSSLAAHKMREHAAPKYRCDRDDCTKEYTTSTALRSHVASCHEFVRYSCPFCPETFVNKAQLKRHKFRHTSPDKLVCKVCEKKFRSRAGLMKHMLIHAGERNFKCTYCPQAFVFDRYLQQHLRIHTGEKPFICDHCGKAFSQIAGLYLHKKSQHKEEFKTEKEKGLKLATD